MSFGRSYHLPEPLRQACAACRKPGNEHLREEWGCDEPTTTPQLWIPCVSCSDGGPDCRACEGRGFEPIYRCPRKLLDPEAGEWLFLHRHWPGALPLAGGLMDQPAIYVSTMRIIDHACDEMKREIDAEREKDNKPNGG